MKPIVLLCFVLCHLLPACLSQQIDLKHSFRELRGGSYSGGRSSSSSGGSWGGRSSSSSSWGGSSSSSSGWGGRSSSSSSNNGSTYRRNNSRRGGGFGRFLGGLLFAGIALALLAAVCPALGIGAAMGGCCSFLCTCLAGVCCGMAAANAAGQQQGYNNNGSTPYYAANQGYPGNSGNYQQDQNQHHNQHHNSYGAPPPMYGAPKQQHDMSGEFEDCARRAKEEVENASMPKTANNTGIGPFSGNYSTSYVDRTTGVQHDATIHLSFSSDFRGKGYKISGEGHDIDGMTVIEDGHCNFDGTAWWRERTVTKDVGLLVLSRGKFDFRNRNFHGTWLASTMEHGAYITFQAPFGNSPKISAPTDDGNIPVATTAEVIATPVNDQTPVVVAAQQVQNHIPVVSGSEIAQSPQTSQPVQAYAQPVNQPTVYVPHY